MLAVETVLKYYFAVVTVAGGLAVLLGTKYTVREWRELPEVKWLAPSLAMGLLALVLASTTELPALLLGNWVLLAITAGIAEESVKLLPLKLYGGSKWFIRWKLVVGTALWLGIIEGAAYTAGIVALGENWYMGVVRLILVGFHTLWAVISVGVLLGESGPRRFAGLTFSTIAHAFYDMPALMALGGYSGEIVAVPAMVSTALMLLTPLMVRKSIELVRGEGMGQKKVEEKLELTEEFTSSP